MYMYVYPRAPQCVCVCDSFHCMLFTCVHKTSMPVQYSCVKDLLSLVIPAVSCLAALSNMRQSATKPPVRGPLSTASG